MQAVTGASSRAFRSRAALPSEWDRRHYGRYQQVQDYLKVDGLTVKYVGPGESDSQAATIFADKPVPQDVALYYYEVTIVSSGDSGYIGVCRGGLRLLIVATDMQTALTGRHPSVAAQPGGQDGVHGQPQQQHLHVRHVGTPTYGTAPPAAVSRTLHSQPRARRRCCLCPPARLLLQA